MVTVRRLGPGDEEVLVELARREADFAVNPHEPARAPVAGAAASAYLADPGVLHWVAEDGGQVVGHLLCYAQRRRASEPLQVLVYEIGVRRDLRRRGIGRRLVAELEEWMSEHGVASAWLLADHEAVAFYEACGFTTADPQSTLMRRRVPAIESRASPTGA